MSSDDNPRQREKPRRTRHPELADSLQTLPFEERVRRGRNLPSVRLRIATIAPPQAWCLA